MVNENLDVQVILDVVNPASPINLGNLAVYVVADTANSENVIPDTKLHSVEDITNLGLSINASTEAIIKSFFAQDNHGETIYLYGIESSVDQSTTKEKVETTLTDGWEFATVVSPSPLDSVVLTNAIESYGRKLAVLGMDLKLSTAKVSDIESITDAPFYGNERTIVFLANREAGDTEKYKGVGALIGALGNSQPGSITWKFKKLKGITATQVNGTVVAKATEIGALMYVSKAGAAQTSEGLSTGLEYIDNLHSDDWVRAEIEASIQNLLQTTDKLPYGAQGIAQLEAAVTTVLRTATENGVILVDPETNSGKFTVTAGSREEQAASDIASRSYKGLSFDYTRAGAIHDVTVHGTIENV
ncbi:DUF3383 family protein [Weissella paramesenteroides]|uniref:DUF3383 family protein n=1 Tax=Weissella paramesenteroides TaxID=1249 RepID=UPI002072E875|nr:DUF3383 family protein [Weissella paramesenteroides]MCM6765677.1 DUF3383 domain-containing protein [Weissella paramesenteroides]MCM6767034.1 DUF3383 domain-containing protein [Weissella paramesenteroides]MCM6771188.1 DUF3383 domain-containing protein [Weissella paramesenteroides]MCM6779719.1 DUF3383 domain-containing protein [Weissella paramesenteroides]MCM6781741.1 DUF3383 domain-containing protein [Weissella paramesenteroides]